MRRWLAAGLLVACASDASSELAASDGGAFPGDPRGAGGTAAPTGDGGTPEQELESLYEAPVATGRYVWVANPRSGRIAFVDAETLAVRTTEAGDRPTHLAALPPACAPAGACEDDRILVLNVGSRDATLVSATTGGTTATFAVPSGGNTWAISPTGRVAVAWTDARKEQRADKTQGFQDVAILDLQAKATKVLAVGYRPVTIGFSQGSERAFAVTQDGISVIELSDPKGPLVSKNVAIADTPLEDPGSRDVSLTPDGAYAFVRRDGEAEVTVVSLTDAARKQIVFDGAVTDFDLSPAGDRAIAVVRDTAKVAILPVPGIWSAPTSFSTIALTGETVGSVSFAPNGSRALVYTNASDVERITTLDLTVTPATKRTVRLYSPVLAAFPGPDGAHAVVFHAPTAAAGSPGERGAFSLLPVAADLPPKIVATTAPPMQVAFVQEGDRALATERDDRSKTFGAWVASFPSLMAERYPLASPPIAAGISARAHRAYVAQEHPEGRITFIDLATGKARTLTGFELAARVVDGSQGR